MSYYHSIMNEKIATNFAYGIKIIIKSDLLTNLQYKLKHIWNTTQSDSNLPL